MNVFTRKVRGFRLLDLVFLGVLVLIIVGVYLAKTIAGGERAEIAKIDRQIDSEKQRIRLLDAEVAHLEQPGRIERLSVAYLGLEPVSAKREATVDQLVDLSRAGPPGKDKAPSPVAALVNGAGFLPGVPPPAPVEAAPVQLAQAKTAPIAPAVKQ